MKLREESDAGIAAWIARRLADALGADALGEGGAVAIAVPGGWTPFPIFAELVRLPLDWRRIEIWPGDDRLVPADHPASNFGRIRDAFASVPARIVPLTEDSRPPRFTLVWLGMGSDGHIASLFPSSDPQIDDPLPVRRVVPDPLPPEAPFARITLTIPALLASDALLFVIRGAGKRAVFDAAMSGRSDLPVARLLAAAEQPVTVFA